MNLLKLFVSVCLCTCAGVSVLSAQHNAWKRWATGLPQGAYPRMTVAPNHDIFFALLGSPTKPGVVFKARTTDVEGSFVEMPASPRPLTVQNNIVALGVNKNSEPIVGVYRTDMSEPWLFRFDNATQKWDTAHCDKTPTLGGQCIATASNGTIYVGTRWAYIYKSTDDGKTFTAIDEFKSVADNYACYYPSFLNGSNTNGSIFSLAVDKRNRVYAGTETAGVLYSDDEGASWHPADLNACVGGTAYDSTSPLSPLANSGNVGSIGFTLDDNVVWSGVSMWDYNWKNSLAFADMNGRTTSPAVGLPDYLVTAGQQISRIVTTTNGTMFLHSGGASDAAGIGIYSSMDGIIWSLTSEGVQGADVGISQGSLAVDGNRVFMATHLGEVWVYEATTGIASDKTVSTVGLIPNPASTEVCMSSEFAGFRCDLLDMNGRVVFSDVAAHGKTCFEVAELAVGPYLVRLTNGQQSRSELLLVQR